MPQNYLSSTFVQCYKLYAKKNVLLQREQSDINDPLLPLVERPVHGAYNGMITICYRPFISPKRQAVNFSRQILQSAA